MNAKSTLTWLVVAGALFAFIFFFEWRDKPLPGPAPLLPGFRASAVTNILALVAKADQKFELGVEFTNAGWWITRPRLYPAEKSRIELLLAALDQLAPATAISRSELQQRPNAEAEFGLDNPQTSLVLQQDGEVKTVKFGGRTAPGDQVFVQVVGREDIYVMDAELLKLLPASPDDWRDRGLGDFRGLKFDTLNLTNAGRIIKLQLDVTNQVWRMTQPLEARADSLYLMAMLKTLEGVRVSGFVPEERRADLEALGLQPPGLSFAFAHGNATAALLQFGRTNAAGQCFMRRDSLDSIATIPADVLAAWQQDFFKYRDLQLLALPSGLTALEIHGSENFTLERAGTNRWRVAGEKFPIDAGRVNEFLGQLGALEIIKFEKDVVTPAEFGTYGLTSSVHQVVFKTALSVAGTNGGGLRLEFGATNGGMVFVRRSDEASVYAVRLADFENLPKAGWQLREQHFWNFSTIDLAHLTARKAGWKRDLVRIGTNSWALGPGSEGAIDPECMEEIARELGQLRATPWVARGTEAADDARFGFSTNSLTLALEMRAGGKMELQFGSYSSAGYPYTRVNLEDGPWVFEFSRAVNTVLLNCLSIPPGAP